MIRIPEPFLVSQLKTTSRKTTSRRKLPRPKTEAVLIKASGDNKMSYADMLKELKTKTNPDNVGSKVGKIRKTGDGNLLIELQKDSKLGEVSGAIRQAVRNQMLVRPMVPTVTIELRDLEETTTEEEIREAFIDALVEATPDQVEVKVLRAGPRGTKVALVVAPRAIATAQVLKPGKVRVGWVNATTREKKLVIICFKCLKSCSNTSLQSVLRISRRSCVTNAEIQNTCHISLACEATGKPYGHIIGDITCAALRIARGKLDHHQNGNG